MMRHRLQFLVTIAVLHAPFAAWAEPSASIELDELPGAGPHAPVAGPEAPPAPAADAPDPQALDLFGLRSNRDGLESRDGISALFALGRIKQETSEYTEALGVWQQALDQVRERHGRWDPRNVTALAGIAAAHRGLDQYQDAIEYYGQAIYINRMNEGLHHPSQLSYLNQIAEMQALLGEWQEAVQLQEYAYYVRQRQHGDDSPEILPALFRMADWYQRTGALLSARTLYERAVNIIERHYGEDDIRLVDPLQKLAMTYRLERYPVAMSTRSEEPSFRITAGGPPPDRDFHTAQRQTLNPYSVGERALVRSVRIQLEHPDASARERAEALIGLADWYLLFDKWNQAMTTYGQVHDLLREAGWDDDQVAEAFADPVALEFPIPAAPSPARWTEGIRTREGYIDLVYDVTDRGRLRNLDITDANPEGLLDFRLRRSVRAARFRPRFVDGAPAATAGVTYRHRYVYYTQPQAPAAEEADELEASGRMQETANRDSG
ncbi:MAG: tetratricopeptide repeat protein [Gammaproteobacteria bacterium]|nr:tetratricopeptide repeat protein [Gammaproteobacteria bacterium]